MRVARTVSLGLLLALMPLSSYACETETAGLGQAWATKFKTDWYKGAGPPLMPEAWYRALRRADDGHAFSGRKSLKRYGFRYCDPPSADGDGQEAKAKDPVGFVARTASGAVPGISFSCAACHTGWLTDGRHGFVVQGGASAVDWQGFATDLFAAVLLARSGRFADAQNAPQWQEFAAAVLGNSSNTESQAALHVEVSAWLTQQKLPQAARHAGGDWGFGRLDRQRLVAANTKRDLASPAYTGVSVAARGPVSIPAVWGAHAGSHLGWTGQDTAGGFASALQRHAAIEWASGVGASGALAVGAVADLAAVERALAQLPAPQWPQAWGRIDRNSADFAAGAALYQNHCAGCHDQARGKDSTLPAITALQVIGTDPVRLCDEITDLVRTGQDGSFGVLPASEAAAQLAAKAIGGTVPDNQPNRKGPVPIPVSPRPGSGQGKTLAEISGLCAPWLTTATGYRAVSLAGVFATAPYLHNGSVPTLDALLSAPEQRPDSFAVGEVLFDPVRVGLGPAVAHGASQIFRATDPSGEPLPGNSNAGHAFPATPLTPVEKAQLILFLKSL